VRLLIVEDSALIRKVTHLAFPSREHELHEAENGLEAIGLIDAADRPFDAIVLDLQMPDMNGVAFILALRQRPRHRDTPIVVATSEAEGSELLQEARRLEVAGVVKKPWKPQELARLVEQAAALRSQTRSKG
jgi:two-component system chemotaxis response regulator CheY